jgi:hypothetical protein
MGWENFPWGSSGWDSGVGPDDNQGGWGASGWGRGTGYLTLSQLNMIFQAVSMIIFQIDGMVAPWEAYIANPSVWTDPVPGNPYELVRIGWPPEGAPAWNKNQDILFLEIGEVDDEYNRQRERIYGQGPTADTVFQRTIQTIVNKIDCVFYGPSSYDRAQFFRHRVYLQDVHDVIAQYGLFLIPSFAAPRRTPEIFQGTWWERVDLSLQFNELSIRIDTTGFIKSADIDIRDEGGRVAYIYVPPSA